MTENLKKYMAKSFLYEEIQKVVAPIKNYAIVKGDPLSLLVFGQCGKRLMSDVDILVNYSDVVNVERSLYQNGFVKTINSRESELFMKSFSHQSVPFVKENLMFGNIYIDINFDVFWGEYEGTKIDITSYLENSMEINLYGTTLKTLTPLYLFVHFALHTYKDMNSIYLLSQRCTDWCVALEELYNLLMRNMSEISIDKLVALCEIYSIKPFIYYVLYHVNYLYEDKTICNYLKALYCENGEYLIGCFGLNDIERKKWPCNLSQRIKQNDKFCIIEEVLTENDLNKINRNKIYMRGKLNDE